MKPVLLATDGSPAAEPAAAKAIELAKLLDTELVVMSVWDIPYAMLGYSVILLRNEFAKDEEDEARKVVTEVAGRARTARVPVKTIVVRGFPVEEICLAAEKLDPQMLVVGSHGWGPVKRLVSGSVSTGVLHHAKVPVLVVRSPAGDAKTEDERYVEAAV
jgi:nucleotide-binding universal stress UspA family protein